MDFDDRPMSKRVTFEEPLFIDIVEEYDEKSDPDFQRPRPRFRKFLLWCLAAVFLIYLLSGINIRRCGTHVHKHVSQQAQKLMRPKHVHTAEQLNTERPAKPKTPSKPTVQDFYNALAKDKTGSRLSKAKTGYTFSKREEQIAAEEVCTTPTCKDWAASIKSNLAPNRTAIDPCEDFDSYVCGGWRNTHDYRADQASVSIGSIMSDVNRNVLHSILEGSYSNNETLSVEAKAIDRGNFDKMKLAYSTCMNEDAIKKYGVAPLRAVLDELEEHYPAKPLANLRANSSDELTQAVIWLAKNSVSGFVSSAVGVDDKNPDVNVIAVGGGETGLPSKEYYNKTDTVANFTRTMAQMFQVVWTGNPITNESIYNDPPVEYMETARKVFELEKKMAFASPDPDTAQEVTYYYYPTTAAEMDKLVPEISISAVLKAQAPAGFDLKMILNSDRNYFKSISSIIKSTPRETIHAYFQSRLIATWAGRLHKDLNKPTRVFSNQMAGRDPNAESERWRTCTSEIDGSLGWLLSASFVQRSFSPDAKVLGDRIVKDIKAVFTERLQGFEWMSNATKEVAAHKVAKIIQKIGYPTASPNVMDPKDLKDYYSKIAITNNWFNNARQVRKFGYEKNWSDLSKPVDRNRWGMTAPTVNAYYSPAGNEIVFPAGIMQLPVFGDELPEYVSYGAFGSVAGHELTHGFDNNGQHYDEDGKYADWWDNATLANFNRKTQCFVDQYAKFTIPDPRGNPVHVNGKLTLGENIADAGGLTASYAAWKRRDRANPNKLMPGLEDFTKEQLFFVSYSNWWCGKVRPAQAINQIYTDPHSPANKRILGTLANSAAFKEAFQCKVKTPTCELW